MTTLPHPAFAYTIAFVSALACSFITKTACAQAAPYLPDDAQVARTKALARSMTVAPTQTRRDQGEVLRTTGIKQPCTMNIASPPTSPSSFGKNMGSQNSVIVVTASPIVNCGL